MEIGEILQAALELPSPAERNAFLDRACGDDPALRARVEGLLRAHAEAGSMFSRPLFDATALYQPGAGEPPGATVGPYKLLQQIGEGGMGTVWMAEQSEPVQRRVALKIIRAGMDSRQVVARFEAERQALALMDHPNIARVLDAGALPDGRPFFVMELVKGVPITAYCDEHRLTPRQRLELFIPVCEAIQHAHQKGIIHRDIKPSNVLVAPYDGRPVVKVIDFGIAKATGQRLTDKTLFTEFGAIVGTLEYMSPEQAELNNQDIDTRSDIYSLGVLLYELLTGSTPLNRKSLREAAFAELLRRIREVDPPRPSTRLSESKELLPSISARRQTDPARLRRLVRGELDWIVMKALDKDRNRRYESASGFALDVRRYLADEPVRACPPSAGYRLRKFVRRNKGPVTAVVLVLLALVGGIVGTTWGLLRAERSRQETEEQAAITRVVNEFVLHDLLGQADVANQPGGGQGPDPDVRVRALLDRAAATIEARFGDRPLVEAAIRLTVGTTYAALAEVAQAERHLQRSFELRRAHLGEDHPDTLESKAGLALVYLQQTRFRPAEELLQEVIAARTAALGADHADTLASQYFLAEVYSRRARLDLAVPLFHEVLERTRARWGDEDVLALKCKDRLAFVYTRQGKNEQAEALHQEVVRATAARVGDKHPDTLLAKGTLAWLYFRQGKHDLAEPLFNEVLKSQTALLRFDHPSTLKTKHELGLMYAHEGKYAEAERLLREVLQTSSDRLGADNFRTLKVAGDLAETYLTQEKYDQAEPLLRQVLRDGVVSLGPPHPLIRTTEQQLLRLFEQQGKPERGAAYFQELLDATAAQFGPENLKTLRVRQALAMFHHRHGRSGQAEPILRDCLAISEREEPDSWKTANVRSLLGETLLGQKKHAEAEPQLLRGYEDLKRHVGKAGPDDLPPHLLPDALGRLVRLYDAWDRPDEAARWRTLHEASPFKGKKDKKKKPKE